MQPALDVQADLDSNPAIEMSDANMMGSTKNQNRQSVQKGLEEIVEEKDVDAYATNKKLLDDEDANIEAAGAEDGTTGLNHSFDEIESEKVK